MSLNNRSLDRFIENNVKQLMLQAVKVDWVLCQLGGDHSAGFGGCQIGGARWRGNSCPDSINVRENESVA